MKYRFTKDEAGREILLTEIADGVHVVSSVATDEDRALHADAYREFLSPPADELSELLDALARVTAERDDLREKLAALEGEHAALLQGSAEAEAHRGDPMREPERAAEQFPASDGA